MKLALEHPFDLTPAEARELQRSLRARVEAHDRLPPLRRVAGLDVGIDRRTGSARGAVVVMSYPRLELLEHHAVEVPVRFPYVPGLLSFREVPALIAALEQLRQLPDLLVCDGQGLAHPRRFGLACHLGVITDLPAIGVAKSRLVGEYTEPGPAKGEWSDLVHQGERIGAVLRTRARVKPVFVSVGHRVSLGSAVRITLGCVTRYRLPETTRLADRLASARGALPQPRAL